MPPFLTPKSPLLLVSSTPFPQSSLSRAKTMLSLPAPLTPITVSTLAPFSPTPSAAPALSTTFSLLCITPKRWNRPMTNHTPLEVLFRRVVARLRRNCACRSSSTTRSSGAISSTVIDPALSALLRWMGSIKRSHFRPFCQQCANFSGEELTEMMMGCDKVCSKFLPSESWATNNEVEGWNEYPCMYSSCVLRAILRLGVLQECDLAIWVLANSPKYGIVIDVAMGDHIVLLIRLCLKAVVREALSKVNGRDLEGGSFECPTLVEALVWLAYQLSKLYGEWNGKLFTINILKLCISDAALGSFVFPVMLKEIEFQGLEEGLLNLDV